MKEQLKSTFKSAGESKKSIEIVLLNKTDDNPHFLELPNSTEW